MNRTRRTLFLTPLPTTAGKPKTVFRNSIPTAIYIIIRSLLLMKKFISLAFAFALTLGTEAQTQKVKLTFLETSDVHGNYLPYDFIKGEPGTGSMSRIYSYVKDVRQKQGKESVILVDNGDILQGQPTAYYYNYIDTQSAHLTSRILNYMDYDVCAIGNHDVETGHAVYDRWTSECQAAMLGANVIDIQTGKSYWKPYTILERKGIRIAVLGMLTPAIPQWLPENLWKGMCFDDLVETARHYMPEMKKQADVIVGVFHSGVGRDDENRKGAEQASVAVARQVPGFDIIFCGHDHRLANRMVANSQGDSVLVINPAANAHYVAQGDLTLTLDNQKIIDRQVKGTLVPVDGLKPDADFLKHFDQDLKAVQQFTNDLIGYNSTTIETQPAFFGSSAFIDLIHNLQLSISKADISFVAPLAFDATIPEGKIYVRDMFNLYRFENMLYVMELSGQEIKDYLEYSYAGWTRQMKSADEHLLLFRENPEQIAEPWQRLQNPSYNFDSAAGICYTVDVTQPAGKKINIISMADGKPFSLQKTYRCAINSYRGNGGGGLLTKGAGINAEELKDRIVWSTDKDLRYYLMMSIRDMKTIHPAPLNNWKFIPENWVKKAQLRDAKLLK